MVQKGRRARPGTGIVTGDRNDQVYDGHPGSLQRNIGAHNATAVAAPEIPETNKTVLGLYVFPKEAHAMWEADPDGVKVLDVRTFEEYTFVGHLEMAHNVPFIFPKYDPKGPSLPGRPPGRYGVPNPDFVPVVKSLFDLDDTILVYCATGGRGALAVNALAQTGFTQVYNIVTGLEGDRVNDPGSVHHGKHMRNGWKNAAPWTYDLDPTKVWIPTGEELDTLRATLDV